MTEFVRGVAPLRFASVGMTEFVGEGIGGGWGSGAGWFVRVGLAAGGGEGEDAGGVVCERSVRGAGAGEGLIE